MESDRSADIHKFNFQAAKRSDLDCFELKGRLLVDCQAWYIQFSKLSVNCNTILQESRLGDVHE